MLVQGGTGENYTYASANPLVLSDPLGLFSWSNFMEDVNTVSGWVSTGASLVAVGCTAAVGTVVNAASGAAISAESCATRKGLLRRTGHSGRHRRVWQQVRVGSTGESGCRWRA